MSEPFIAEIKIFAGNFAPRGYAFCDGALLLVAQNTALFSLVGTTYGGDGRTTYGLPNLSGRAPMHAESGPGLTPRRLGDVGGVEDVSLTIGQMPNHTHTAQAASSNGADEEGANLLGKTSDDIYGDGPVSPMSDASLGSSGGSASHTNMQPYLVMNFIIALEGLYPSRG